MGTLIESSWENEQLRAELQAAREEIDSIQYSLDVLETEKYLLRDEIAAHQLVIKQMREVLEAVGAVIHDDVPMEVNVQIALALSNKPSTEALDAYVQRAVEQEREAWKDEMFCVLVQDMKAESARRKVDEYAEAIRRRGK